MKEFTDGLLERRHRETRAYTEVILGRALPRDARHERLIDELEAVTSEEVYWILVVERGWTSDRYEDYLYHTFVATLGRHDLALEEGSEG